MMEEYQTVLRSELHNVFSKCELYEPHIIDMVVSYNDFYPQFYLDYVRKCGLVSHVPDEYLTEEIHLEAMKHNQVVKDGMNLRIVPIKHRTSTIIANTIRQSGSALYWIPGMLPGGQIPLEAYASLDVWRALIDKWCWFLISPPVGVLSLLPCFQKK